jgi:hypothetical protein
LCGFITEQAFSFNTFKQSKPKEPASLFMADKTLTPKLLYHPLLKGGLTPTIHRWGEKQPAYSALKLFEQLTSDCFTYAQRKEPRQSKAKSSRWQSHEDPLDIQQDKGTLGYLYHSLFQRYSFPLNPEHQQFFEREVDVLEVDGKISKQELAHYLYRVDQAGNQDGVASQEEVHFGQFVAQKRFLMEEGARLGLNKKELVALYQKLRSNEFTATAPTFEETHDVIGQQTDKQNAMLRLNKIMDNWERCSDWTTRWMPAEKTAILRNLLKFFTESGSMPLPEYTDHPPGQKSHPLSFILIEGVTAPTPSSQHRRISILKTRIFWIDPKDRSKDRGDSSDPLADRLLKPSLKQRDIKKPNQYRIKPHEITCPTQPDAQHLHAVLTRLSQRLQDQLHHPDTQPHLETFVQNIAHSLHNSHLMAIRLYPIFEALCKALNLNPGHIQFLVKETLDDKTQNTLPKRVTYGECMPIYEGSIEEAPKISTQVSLSRSAFADYYKMMKDDEYLNRNEIARVILKTLIEEVVHAWQFQTMVKQGDAVYLKQSVPQSRILDYQECQTFHYPDFSLMKTYTGRSDMYEKNPIEVDAKWVAQEVSKGILDTIKALPEAEPILLTLA